MRAQWYLIILTAFLLFSGLSCKPVYAGETRAVWSDPAPGSVILRTPAKMNRVGGSPIGSGGNPGELIFTPRLKPVGRLTIRTWINLD